MAILLILALNVLVFVGVNASRVVFSLYGLHLGANSAGVGGILAMMYVFPLLLSWPIGVLSDRFGSRWLLAVGAASGSMGMLIPYFVPSMTALYAASLLVGAALGLGVVGYHYLGGLPWIDALVNASMILGGMGPVDPITAPAGKLFASFYALFSGLLFIGAASLVLAPFVHRVMHRLHLDDE